MKTFHCDNCENLVYFENVICSACNHEVGFIPALGSITALVPAENGLWQQAGPNGAPSGADVPFFRKCQNYSQHNICNWLVAADDPEPLCVSCRLTHTIPDLDLPGHRDAWVRLESAKRRLMYSLLELQLPVEGKIDDRPEGVVFKFMADDPNATDASGKVLTGHDDGTIVINIAEADDAERERRRIQMHEPYRTLLGHLRHEIGHYYWDVLIRDSDRLEACRALFGDDRADYGEALKRHYEHGAPENWRESFVSTYATSHPWEDWAETWAHYMHISDTLETADRAGLSLQPHSRNEPALQVAESPQNPASRNFEEIMERWIPLTYLLNNLNRGLGLANAYPFVLSVPAFEKLRFVHETIGLAKGASPVDGTSSLSAASADSVSI